MTKLVCKECKCIITENMEDCKDSLWIECPTCGRTFINPYFEGVKNDN